MSNWSRLTLSNTQIQIHIQIKTQIKIQIHKQVQIQDWIIIILASTSSGLRRGLLGFLIMPPGRRLSGTGPLQASSYTDENTQIQNTQIQNSQIQNSQTQNTQIHEVGPHMDLTML